MKHILIVGIGGALGAISRYKLGGLVMHHTLNWKLPVSTMAVNITGCLITGILAGLIQKHDMFNSAELRLLLFTGILGGFTTFSAFGLETIYLMQKHQFLWAGANVAITLLACLIAAWMGITAIR